MLSNRISLFVSTLFLLGGLLFSIFFFSQEKFAFILFGYGLSFIGYIGLVKNEVSVKRGKIVLLIIFGLKCVSLFVFPNLSDDVYRFWWDGFIHSKGINPFAFTPSELISTQTKYSFHLDLITQYSFLNSKNYYSVYPSFCQFLFYVSSHMGGSDVAVFNVILKCFFLGADAGILCCLFWLFNKSIIPFTSIVFVVCNPLYIMEGIFNFHFEFFVILFILFSWISMYTIKPFLGGLSLGLAVMTKLNPILLVPAMVIHMSGFKNKVAFIIPCMLMILTLPLLVSDYLYHFFQSVRLYFNQFEFNSFLYRPLTFICEKNAWWVSKNQIGLLLAGCFLLLFAVYHIVYLWPTKKQNPLPLLWLILFTFLLCSSTVHPWYILPLLAISSLGVFRWTTIIWSMCIVFSYSQYDPSTQNLEPWLRAIEYAAVLLTFFFELRTSSIFFKDEITPYQSWQSGL